MMVKREDVRHESQAAVLHMLRIVCDCWRLIDGWNLFHRVITDGFEWRDAITMM